MPTVARVAERAASRGRPTDLRWFDDGSAVMPIAIDVLPLSSLTRGTSARNTCLYYGGSMPALLDLPTGPPSALRHRAILTPSGRRARPVSLIPRRFQFSA